MKKLLCFLILTCVLVAQPETPVQAHRNATAPEWRAKAQTTTLRKRKGYRKKKGFMWGLFRKKSGCGCPNG